MFHKTSYTARLWYHRKMEPLLLLNVAWFMIAGDKSAEVFITKVWFSGIVLPSINFEMTNVFFIARFYITTVL